MKTVARPLARACAKAPCFRGFFRASFPHPIRASQRPSVSIKRWIPLDDHFFETERRLFRIEIFPFAVARADVTLCEAASDPVSLLAVAHLAGAAP